MTGGLSVGGVRPKGGFSVKDVRPNAGIAKLAVTAIVSSWAEEEPTKSIMASETVSNKLQARVTHLLNSATVTPTLADS